MYIFIGMYALGSLVLSVFPYLQAFLCFDAAKILKGEVWRLVTYLLATPESNIFLLLITSFIYISITKTLEQFIGKFRVDFFLVTGIVLQWIYGFLYYLICSSNVILLPHAHLTRLLNPMYVYTTLFILFSFIFPDAQFLFMFIFPIRGKWLIFITLILDIIDIARYFAVGLAPYGWFMVGIIVFSILNMILYYLIFQRDKGSFNRKKANFNRSKIHVYSRKESSEKPRHCCAVCGRTEITNPELEFRYCSHCVGNYEYCSVHLYTHTHIRPGSGNKDTE